MKLVLAMMKHETNTFSPIVTDWERFESWGLYTGQAAIDAYGKTNMPIGVYLKLVRDYGAEVVLPIAAEGVLGGREIGRATGRDRGGQDEAELGGGGAFKKTKTEKRN